MIRFGFTQPVLINDADNKILAGHGRIKALQQLHSQGYEAPKRIDVTKDTGDDKIEYWSVPCHYININDKAEAEAYLIADNRLTEIGGWLDDKLIDSLQNILEETGSLDGIGWDLEDLDDLASITDEPIEVEEDVVKLKIGKYKAEVSKTAYDQWLIMVQKQVGKEKEDIVQWIVEQLQIEIV